MDDSTAEEPLKEGADAFRGGTILHLVKIRLMTSPEVLCEKLAEGFSRLYRARNLIVSLQPGDEPSGPEFQKIAKPTVLPSGFMNLLREGQIIAREQRPAAVILYTIGFNQIVFISVQSLRAIECDPYTDSADALANRFIGLFAILARGGK